MRPFVNLKLCPSVCCYSPRNHKDFKCGRSRVWTSKTVGDQVEVQQRYFSYRNAIATIKTFLRTYRAIPAGPTPLARTLSEPDLDPILT